MTKENNILFDPIYEVLNHTFSFFEVIIAYKRLKLLNKERIASIMTLMMV